MVSYEDNTQISVYIDNDLDNELQRRADKQDMSKSAYVREVLSHHVQQDILSKTSREAEVEQRIEELVVQAQDDLTETTQRALSEIIAQTELMNRVLLHQGMYSIGTWDLIKHNFGEAQRQDAMQAATRRLEANADEMGINLNALGTDKPTLDEHSQDPKSEPGADEDSNNDEADDDDDDDDWHY